MNSSLNSALQASSAPWCLPWASFSLLLLQVRWHITFLKSEIEKVLAQKENLPVLVLEDWTTLSLSPRFTCKGKTKVQFLFYLKTSQLFPHLIYYLFRQIIDKFFSVAFSFQGEGYWKEGIFIFHVMIPEEYNIKVGVSLNYFLSPLVQKTPVSTANVVQ